MKEYSGTHKASVFAALNSDRSAEDSYCDIILEVDGRKFPVHKCILGKISTFFNRMFKTEMKEKYVGTVQIHGITSTLMENILEYIYTESINIEEESAVELLKAADYLQLDELKSLCTFFFSELINITNCFDLLELGITFDCSLLCEKAEVVIASKFEKFAKEGDYLKILPRCFLNIMKHVDQKNYISTKLYEAATKWIKWDQENRSKYFVDCLKIINFKSLSTAFIQDVLDNEALIQDSHTCKDYILKMLLNRLKLSSTESNEDNAAGKAASPDENKVVPFQDQNAAAEEDRAVEEVDQPMEFRRRRKLRTSPADDFPIEYAVETEEDETNSTDSCERSPRNSMGDVLDIISRYDHPRPSYTDHHAWFRHPPPPHHSPPHHPPPHHPPPPHRPHRGRRHGPVCHPPFHRGRPPHPRGRPRRGGRRRAAQYDPVFEKDFFPIFYD